jgi:hypothetical protein
MVFSFLAQRLTETVPADYIEFAAREFPVMGFEEKYPSIAAWVKGGWVEIGYAVASSSFIRVLDEG